MITNSIIILIASSLLIGPGIYCLRRSQNMFELTNSYLLPEILGELQCKVTNITFVTHLPPKFGDNEENKIGNFTPLHALILGETLSNDICKKKTLIYYTSYTQIMIENKTDFEEGVRGFYENLVMNCSVTTECDYFNDFIPIKSTKISSIGVLVHILGIFLIVLGIILPIIGIYLLFRKILRLRQRQGESRDSQHEIPLVNVL